MFATMDGLREDELLVRVVLAEGLDEIVFAEDRTNAAAMWLEFIAEGFSTELMLVPQRPQEPLR